MPMKLPNSKKRVELKSVQNNQNHKFQQNFYTKIAQIPSFDHAVKFKLKKTCPKKH